MTKEIEVEEKALTVISEFKMATMPAASLSELLQSNLAGQPLNPWDMDTIKFPSQKSTKWSIPDITNEDGYRDEKELVGVILHYADARRYWKGKYGESEASAPDCISRDTIAGEGEGDPGGNCKHCEYGQWSDDGAPECKITRDMLLLLPDHMLPVNISIGPGSYTNMKKYFIKLVDAGVPYWKAVTSITLNTSNSANGTAFPKANVRMVEEVKDEVILDAIDAYRDLITKSVSQD